MIFWKLCKLLFRNWEIDFQERLSASFWRGVQLIQKVTKIFKLIVSSFSKWWIQWNFFSIPKIWCHNLFSVRSEYICFGAEQEALFHCNYSCFSWGSLWYMFHSNISFILIENIQMMLRDLLSFRFFRIFNECRTNSPNSFLHVILHNWDPFQLILLFKLGSSPTILCTFWCLCSSSNRIFVTVWLKL